MKEKIKKLFGQNKCIFAKYKGTLILLITNTILSIFLYDNSDFSELITALAFTNILFFALDTFNNKNKIVFFLLSAIISAFLNHTLYITQDYPHVPVLIFGLYIVIFFLTLYKISLSEKDFTKYFLKVLNNNLLLIISSFILELGIIFITLVLEELLITNISFNLIIKFELLLLGLFIIPGELLCLVSPKDTTIKQIKSLICYILLPIVLVIELIIYLYFLKILISLTIPSNMIFGIITSLFIILAPTWLLINNYKEDNQFIYLSHKIIPYSFIPMIIMQIYSLGIRIIEHGYTIDRYVGMMLIIFEIITIIIFIIKKHYHKLLLSLSLIFFISLCLPYVNAIDISRYSQLQRLTSIYQENINFDELSLKDKITIKNIYYYLTNNLNASKYIPKYIDKSKISSIYEDYSKNNLSINYINPINEISVAGYSKIKPLSVNIYDDNLTINNLSLYEEPDKNNIIINNLKNYLNEAIVNNEISNYIIILDENHSYWISNCYLNYNSTTINISSLNLDGYLLIK